MRRQICVLGAVTLVIVALSFRASEVVAEEGGLPQGLVELPLEGFNPSVFVAPDGTSPGPWPLTVILHGNFDRPEWECEIWAKTLRPRGWLLCPRGYPRTDVSKAADRWTYQGRAKLAREIEAGVAALEQRYPGKLRRDDAWLVGFSLGANMTPRLLPMKVLPFTAVVLAEGGLGVTVPQARTAAARGVKRVVYVCGERTYCPRRSRQLAKIWRQGHVPGVKTIIMPGVGHGYPESFDPIGQQVIQLLNH